MKTFIGVVLTLDDYQIFTINEESIGKYDFAFEVNWQEIGVRKTKVGITSYEYPSGGFDMRLFHKGVDGDLKINGWVFPGFLSGKYELQGESYWRSLLDISILDPEGNLESVGIEGNRGTSSFYSSIALNYIDKIFEYCIYKNTHEHELATRPQSRYLLQCSTSSPKELIEQISILQIMAKSIVNLDTCEEIPEHVKKAARKKYQSLLTQIKNSTNFEMVIDKLLGFDLK